jgi:tetratricopeptide (TPR) repeat protein
MFLLYKQELQRRVSPEEREDIYHNLAYHYYEQKGKIIRTIEALQNAIEEHKKSAQFYEMIMYSIHGYKAHLFAMIGEIDSSNKVLHELEAVFGEKYKHITARRKLYAFSHLEQADSIENIIGDLTGKYNKHFDLARIAEIRGQYDDAVENFNICLESSTANFEEEYTYLGRIYRKMDNFDEAGEAFNEALKMNPYYAPALYEKAILHWEQGDKEEAIVVLNKALDVWKDADPEYIRAQKARILMEEWEGSKSD